MSVCLIIAISCYLTTMLQAKSINFSFVSRFFSRVKRRGLRQCALKIIRHLGIVGELLGRDVGKILGTMPPKIDDRDRAGMNRLINVFTSIYIYIYIGFYQTIPNLLLVGFY